MKNLSSSSSSSFSSFFSTLLAIAFAVLSWFRLVVYNSDLLYEAQDQGFWQPGELYFQQVMQQPGGWFSWAGQYLTQFFYYPALGASILIVLWLCIYVLWLSALRLKWQFSWVALIVPCLLLWAETSMGYSVYVSKVPDWWFAPTLFTLFVSLLLWAGRWMKTWVRLSWQGVCLVVALVMAGQWMDDAQVPQPLRTPFYSSLDDANFRAEMRMERAAEDCQWGEVLKEMRAAQDGHPTRPMWLYKNIALLHQGRLATNWLDYPCLTQMPVMRDSVMVPMVEMSGPMIYFLHGSIEFAYRWSMENMVEYGPSMKRLRLMTRCALVKGEWALAEKYLKLLSNTTFHRDWAREQRRFLHRPDLLAEDPFYALPIQLSQARVNLLDGDRSKAEEYLVNNCTTGSVNHCKEMAELGVIYALQMQDIPRFWNRFRFYAVLTDGEPMPLLFQQAVYLFLNLEPQSSPQAQYPFDKSVPADYQRFNQRAQQLSQQGLQDEKLAQALQREFGKTYYWFYFFCRGLSSY